MGAEQPLIASDGLLARKSGEWAKRKLHFLRNYCGITTVAMRKKWRLRYLDVMAGPGRCKNAETGAEFPGSPFVALDYGFNDFLFVEEDVEMANALEERIRQHPKKELIQIVRRDWTELARSGKLKFSDDTLVVAFIDPTGISQVPMDAMLQLTKNKRIDLLVTIQHSLGITRNLSQYLKSETGRTAMDRFLASDEWRQWKWKNPSEFARLAIDAFGKRIKREGFIGTRHISIPENHPLYRFTLFSRHERAENFWNKILKIDESGQRELL